MTVMMNSSEYDNFIINMCETAKSRVKNPNVDDITRITPIWKLLEQIFNVKIGHCIKTYRSDTLTRNNDVNFRTIIAVKSERRII